MDRRVIWILDCPIGWLMDGLAGGVSRCVVDLVYCVCVRVRVCIVRQHSLTQNKQTNEKKNMYVFTSLQFTTTTTTNNYKQKHQNNKQPQQLNDRAH